MNKKIVIKDNKLYKRLLFNVLNVDNILIYPDAIYIDREYISNGYKHYKYHVSIMIEIGITDIYLEDVIINVKDFSNMNTYRYGYNIKNTGLYYFTGRFYIDEYKFNLYGYEYLFKYIINTVRMFDKLMKVGVIVVEFY